MCPPSVSAESPQRSTWPLVPRAAHSAAIAQGLALSPARAQLIVGPAGTGKSVLAEAAARSMQGRSVVPVFAMDQLRSVPLGALATTLALLRLPTEPDVAVARLVAHLGKEPHRYVVLVDDAPRLDEVSAATVYHLVRGLGVATVLTARLGEELPAPLVRLMDEGLTQRHDVVGLGLDEVGALIELVFGARARHADVVRLAERTEGNPLYLRNLIELASSDGAVRVEQGSVSIADGHTPLNLIDSVTGRLASLTASQRHVLGLVALMQPVASAVAAQGDQEAAALERLVAFGLVSRSAGTVRVAHPLVAESLVGRHSQVESDERPDAREAAGRLRAAGGARERFAACRLELDSGIEPGADELVWAAGYAQTSGDLVAAIDLAQAVLAPRVAGDAAAAPGRALTPSQAFAANIVAASALSGSGSLSRAEPYFDAAAAIALTPQDSALLAVRRGEHLAFRRFRVADAVAQAEAALPGLPGPEAAAVTTELRAWRAILGQAPSDHAAEQSASPSPELAVRAAMTAVMSESMSGRHAAAKQAAEVILHVQERMGVLDPHAVAMIEHQRYFDLLAQGRGDEAGDFVQSRRLASVNPSIGLWTYTLGIHRMYNGRLAEASRLASLATEQLKWRDGIGLLAASLALEACIAAQQGSHERATGIVAAMEQAQRDEPKAAMLLAETQAWLLAGQGRPADAVDVVCGAAESAARLGFHLVGAITVGLAIRLGGAERAAPLLSDMCSKVGPGLGLYEALRDVATGLAERRPDVVAAAARKLTAAGMGPTAADAIAQARSHAGDGESRRKLDLAWHVAIKGIDAPLATAPERPLLTSRELEVALAAGRRERSKEIAERLNVSVRTVDNQLASAYRKLGVTSRDELREALEQAGLA